MRSRELGYHAEKAHADIGLGTLQILKERFGLEHDLAARHGSVEQIGVALLVNDDDTIVGDVEALDLGHQRDEVARPQRGLERLVVEPRALEVREAVVAQLIALSFLSWR